MAGLARTLLLSLAAVAALAAAGCGNKTDEPRTLAETEGLYLDLDELSYQVQLSRILNPAAADDRAYLLGLAEGVTTRPDEVWFGVWMRVANESDEPHRAADQFEITDTQENRFTPVVLDEKANPFAYRALTLQPGGIIPVPNSASASGPIQGSLLLFKVKVPSLYNRPLEFHITSSQGGAEGIVDLDV